MTFGKPSLYRRLPLWLLFVVAFSAALPAQAQFRNQGIKVPSVGWNTHWTADLVQGLYENKWNSSDHVSFGSGYQYALGYDLWMDVGFELSGGMATLTQAEFSPLLGISPYFGIHYNFLSEEYRPFVSAQFATLAMVGTQNTLVRKNDLSALQAFGVDVPPQSFWAGVRVGGGFEWFFLPSLRSVSIELPMFYDEMSLTLEVLGALYIDWAGWPLMSSTTRLTYNVYF